MQDQTHTTEPACPGAALSRRQVLVGGMAGLTIGACSSPAPAGPGAQATASGTTRPDGAPPPSGASPVVTTEPAAPPSTPKPGELPRGGRSVFPRYRLAGFCGYPGSAALGKLGTGDLDERADEIVQLATTYARDRAPLPVLELLATVVRSTPGADGLYRTRTPSDVIDRHLQVARARQAYLLLNIQPGRASFLDEVHAYERWLTEPDVGVALDPEWAVGPGELPGRVFGHVETSVLNAVGQYVSGLVVAHDLPEKVVVYHQLTPSIVRNEQSLQAFPGIAWVKSVDGIGAKTDKVSTWNKILATTPTSLVHLGFKLFYTEDAAQGALMTPEEVLALSPQPEYVMYE